MMPKIVIEGIEIEDSTGNVFTDLDLPDADRLKIQSGLMIEIVRAMRRLGSTHAEASLRVGISQSMMSGMMRGDFSDLSESKLAEGLKRLGYEARS